MVSFWPWKGEDNSPASFEKALSTLSTKIAEATARLDQQRQTSRRFKALWTLYSTFAYLFYSIILALVLGWESWGAKEYAAIGGGPILIYAVRSIAGRFFEYRITRSQRSLDVLNKQRDETIEKLKVATKYNSTQQLLEKYGGESPKPPSSPKNEKGKRAPSTPHQQQPVGRTGLPPPPTANIRRPSPMQPPAGPANQPSSPPPFQTPVQPQPYSNTPTPSLQSPDSKSPTDEPGFAPNAFSNQGQYIEQPHWYDRLLDVLLGEDEMQPRNRMVMICSACRLVNGQAPPGIKTLEELGRWRCGGCGAWNGVESEATQILSSLRQADAASAERSWDALSHEETSSQSEDVDDAVVANKGEDEHSAGRQSDKEETRSDYTDEESKPKPRRDKRNRGGKAKQ